MLSLVANLGVLAVFMFLRGGHGAVCPIATAGGCCWQPAAYSTWPSIPAYIPDLFFTILIDYVAGIQIEKATGRRRSSFWC